MSDQIETHFIQRPSSDPKRPHDWLESGPSRVVATRRRKFDKQGANGLLTQPQSLGSVAFGAIIDAARVKSETRLTEHSAEGGNPLLIAAKVGDARYSRPECGLLLGALTLLKEKLDGWNKVATEHGAAEAPYVEEVADLNRMIEWYKERLFANPSAQDIWVGEVSVGSLRYHKAALIHVAWVHEQNVDVTAKSDWPSAVQESLRSGIHGAIAT